MRFSSTYSTCLIICCTSICHSILGVWCVTPTLNPDNKATIQLYATNERSLATDPGQAHQRELQIKYVDGTFSSFSFDSGMSFFSPFIDREWNYEREFYQTMMIRMEKSLYKYAKFLDSLIFYYPEVEDQNALSIRFDEALKMHRIKVID